MKKLDRTTNASRNIMSGFALKVFQLIIPFILRTVIIYCLGIEYLGLNTLFSSILQILSLAELGVGTAMVFSMYKPIVEDDQGTICALMQLYKIYYRIIGIIILVMGLVLLPFLPQLIKSDIPSDMNLYVLYLFNLSATVLSYWLFAYKNCLLTAHQRNDISNKVTLIVQVVQYIVQFIVLFLFKNYYYYVIVTLLAQVCTNISTEIVVSKMYPQYRAAGKLSKEETKVINRKIKDLFTAKLGSVILTSVDSVVISAFLGLKTLAIYNNYYYIVNAIMSFVTIMLTSITAGLGNSFITETKERNFITFQNLTFILLWLLGIGVTCFMCLYQPFMEIWVGQENMLSIYVVIFLCAYFYICEINALLNTFKDAAGIWHIDRFRPLTVAFTNLVLNLVSVKFIGVYGIILSTVVSILCVGMPWVTHNVFKYIFDGCSKKKYILKVLKFTVVIVVGSAIAYWVCKLLPNGVIFIAIRLIVCILVSNILYWVVFRRYSEYRYMLNMMYQFKDKIIKKQYKQNV